MKIKTCKFYQPVRVGSKQHSYIEPNNQISVVLKGPLVEMTDKEGNRTYTSLYNVPYFTVEEIDEPSTNSAPSQGSRAKKSRKST